ncbi:hypothetical protein [Clostridium beijerinckii]|uniref:hypothetical protein n=1 Tax=Clostridium beijerinckii TaxID=1520 RepID=UPI0022E10DC7|nr:hypothetical protein [Clostridium beijerinckii]
MKDTIDEFINSKKINSGLFLADLPTGYGKTYIAARSIHDYVTAKDNPQKVFFITTLVKNLPIEELKNAYKEFGDLDGYNRDVLVIKSNFDFVRDSILELDIPERYRTSSFFALYEKIKLLNSLESKKDTSIKAFKDIIKNEIREKYEPAFRRDIQGIIRKELPKSIALRREIIRTNSDYRWIGVLYPTVFMSDYKVFLLTVDKFLVRNTTLIEPSYDFIQNAITDNSIIFIDEFDAAKETIQNVIIKRALDSQDDYIKLFEQVYKAMNLHEFPISMMRPYQEYIQDHMSIYTFENLLNEAKGLYSTFQMKYSYKTVSGSIDRKQSFLFNDNSYHTMLRNNCNYIRVTPNEEEKQVRIYFENKDDYYKNKSENDIIMYSLIRGINSFLNKFKIMIYNWSARYAESINAIRRDDEDEFTIENAMKTIYREFALSESQIHLLMGDLCGSKMVNDDNQNIIPDMSFYNNGFKYFEFADSDEHLSQTIFNYVQILDTPEKILLYLCSKSKVIGISATATLPTVTGNFDMKYLANSLGASYITASKDIYKKINQDLEKRWSAYSSGLVKVNVEVVDYNKDNLTLEEHLMDISSDRDFIKKYNNLISIRSAGNKYIWTRYCNIFRALKEFVKHDDIKSFLCLNMVLPQLGKASFDIELINEALNDLVEIYADLSELSAEKCIVTLKSDNFEVEKEDILNRLSKGEKIFIMSSYKTIGAGQNLQYEVKDVNKFVTIFQSDNSDDKRLKYKDMDALYLGDITNLVANTFDTDNFDKADMLRYFFQIEYLYQNDEINYSTLNRLIKLGFRTYSGSHEKDVPASKKMRESRSIMQQVTRDVMQAVGRICRTYIKNSTIYLYTVEGLISKIDVDCLEGRIISPEMKAIVNSKKEFGYNYTEQEEELLNCAERISSRGKNFIMRMLSRNWNSASINLWKTLREVVLAYPTVNKDESMDNEIISSLYIENKGNCNSYLFAQKGDFSDVVIDFDNDKIVFSESKRCDGRIVSVVSEDEARLSEILKYSGMRQHFFENGWATKFDEKELILSPVLFQNIYKGALGEVAGKFILHKELDIELKEIEDPEKFEFFDYEIVPNVYVDFKHWKQNYPEERDVVKAEIARKLDSIGGKRVYIINIIAEGEFSTHVQNDKKIIEIPSLLNKDGLANEKVLKLLRGEVFSDN